MRRKKALLMLVVELVCVTALGVFLFRSQTQTAANKYHNDIRIKLSQMDTLVANAQRNEQQVRQSFDEVYQARADAFAYMARELAPLDMSPQGMEQMRSLLDVSNLLVVDRQGQVVAAAGETPADFSRARFNRLRSAFANETPEPFVVEYPTGACSYYAAKLDGARIVVVEQDTAELDALCTATSGWDEVLGNVHVGLEGFCMAVSDRDHTFLYHPDAAMEGKDALAHGVDMSGLEDGWCGAMTLNGQRYYCGVAHIPDSGAYILCAVSEAEIAASRGVTVGVILFTVFAVLTVVITYAILLLNAEAKNDRGERSIKRFGGWVFDKGVARRIGSIALVGLIVIVGISFYMQTLFSLSQHAMSNSRYAAAVEETLTAGEEETQEILAQYNKRYLNKAQVAAYIIARLPQPVSRETLSELSRVLDVKWTSLFNDYGVIEVTDSAYGHFRLGNDPTDQSYAFRSLLNGAPYVIQPPMADDLTGEYMQYIGASIRDETGESHGFVQIAVEPSRLEEALAGTSLRSILSGVTHGVNGYAFAVDKAQGTFSYHPQQNLIGRSALDYGVPKAALTNGYCDFMTVAGERCFGTVVETQDDYVFVALPANEVMGDRLSSTLATLGVCFACLLVICLLLTLSRESDAPAPAKEKPHDDKEDANAMIDVVMPDGQVKKTAAVAARWDNIGMDWSSKTPEQQTVSIIKGLMCLLAAIICVIALLGDRVISPHSILAYILSGRWQRGLNHFAVTACLIDLCLFVVGTMLVQRLLKMLANTLDARGETICRLMRSFVKYISVIAALYYCLALFGVDTATLLASAGILSLVIGLGAKSLVSDIIAGLFLIFEGDFRVGDIVTVGDWRGTVTEIGIRTTKIEDGAKNVKVISNSDVNGIINMTRKYSLAVCNVGIEYGESLERVETVLAKELPKLQKKLPAILEGPFYKGVTELGESSVNLRIVAECSESDRFQLVRDLNREIKLIFDRNDINIPFPQVVVNQPQEFKAATAAEKRRAEAFTKEQSELSKDIVDSAEQ